MSCKYNRIHFSHSLRCPVLLLMISHQHVIGYREPIQIGKKNIRNEENQCKYAQCTHNRSNIKDIETKDEEEKKNRLETELHHSEMQTIILHSCKHSQYAAMPS